MHHYLTQLLHDLESVAANPPERPWIEPPPHMADDIVMAELALVPFKPISEWTGIDREAFPDMMDLTTRQCRKLNEAILRVYASLNLSLTDLPKDIPQDELYDVLSSNWDHPVQYLPSSGMDMELCTHDPQTCPYGDYCEYCDQPPLAKPEVYCGFYDDDGKKIDPKSVPVPPLCLICKSYASHDWEENLLCLMNRNDQKDSEEFECGAFEKS